MNISRREFLRLLGITGALAGGIPNALAVPDDWLQKLRSGPRIESWKVSTCGQCPAGCGIRIRLIDGIPVRITGNPISPVNRGFICPMGEAGLELLYNPDRLLHPQKLTGEKGSGKLETVTWNRATDLIESSLKEMVTRGNTSRFGFLIGDFNTEITRVGSEFASSFGSPNFFPWRSQDLNEAGSWEGFSGRMPLSFDLNECEYLLTFGTNLLEEPPSPVYFNRVYAEMKALRARSGKKMVHVGPRMSQAGINANEWVRVKPGTMGVLALGMAYVILRDRTEDRRFISAHTSGFKRGKDDFASLVTKDYSPERVSEVTGISASKIIRIAREFSSSKAPLALSGGISGRSETSTFDQWAVMCLNAISGSFSVAGLWRDSPAAPWGSNSRYTYNAGTSSFAAPGVVGGAQIPSSWAVENLPSIMSGKDGVKLDVLFIAQADPLYASSDRKGWEEFLARIPLVVQFATLKNDTSPHADLILPASTYLEQWEIARPAVNLPFSSLGLFQPIVGKFGGARAPGDVLLDLFRRLGISSPWKSIPPSYEGHVKARMKSIFSSRRGTPYFEEVSLEFLKELRRRGWQVYSYPTFSDFWKILEEKGGWWEPGGTETIEWNREKRFRFITPGRLKELIKKRAPAIYRKERGEIGKAPHLWIEKGMAHEDDERFILYPFGRLFNMTGAGASQPLLQELFGLHQRVYWKTWAEMNPERAEKLGVEDGDMVRVVSESGSFTLPVKVVPTVSPEILAIPIGQGQEDLGSYGKGVGKNPFDLMSTRLDPIGSRESWQSTVVHVEPVK